MNMQTPITAKLPCYTKAEARAIERFPSHQHKILAALVAAEYNRGETRTLALARRAKMTSKCAFNAMSRLSEKGLVQDTAWRGTYTITAEGWKEAGVKPPLWVTV